MVIKVSTEAMIGIIIASILGGVILFLIIGCIAYFCCCRQKRKSKTSENGAPYVIKETRNNHGNPIYEASPVKVPDRRTTEETTEPGKAIGYAYPIVSGRPVSFPHFTGGNNAATPTSTTGTKSSNPPRRQSSQMLPPNAYRLPGLADKSFSMSDSNLSTVGTLNPAYDPTGDNETTRPVSRAQSLMQVARPSDDFQNMLRMKSSTTDARPNSKVYHFDGSLGCVTVLDEKESSHGSSNNRPQRLPECKEVTDPPESAPDRRIRVAHELQQSRKSDNVEDHIYAMPKRPAPSAPQRLPRVPLDTPVAKSTSPPPEPLAFPSSPTRRSLTSEMSYRAKGHIVTAEAFDFLEGYNDDPAKS